MSKRQQPTSQHCNHKAVTMALLSDDFAARRLALKLGIPVSGTLGVLLQLVHNHHITMQEADALLARMIGKGYRSPVTSLTEIHTT